MENLLAGNEPAIFALTFLATRSASFLGNVWYRYFVDHAYSTAEDFNDRQEKLNNNLATIWATSGGLATLAEMALPQQLSNIVQPFAWGLLACSAWDLINARFPGLPTQTVIDITHFAGRTVARGASFFGKTIFH